MSKLKQMLGLAKAGISDSEIMRRLIEADSKELDEVEFVKSDGSVIKIRLPHVGFDPALFQER